MRITIKKALLLGIILLQVVTITTILTSNYLSSQRSFDAHAHKLMIDYADNITQNSKRFLDSAKATTQLTGQLISRNVLSIDHSQDLSLYFHQQLIQSPYVTGIYFADIKGEFVHVQREKGLSQSLFTQKLISLDASGLKKQSTLHTMDENFNQLSVKDIADESYDPRDRIWFNKALENNELSWTDPYVFFSSRQPGITSSMPIYDREQKLIGVVGVDISLATISSFFTDINLGENSIAFITNRLGEIIAYPDQAIIQHTASESLRFPRINEIENPIALSAWEALQAENNLFAFEQNSEDISFSYNGKKYHGLFKEFTHHKWPWLITIYMPEDFFLADLVKNQKVNILVGLIISIIACVISFLFINRITDSLEKVKDIATNITQGKFIKTSITQTRFAELQQTQYAFNKIIDSLIDSNKENQLLTQTLEKTSHETLSRLGCLAEYNNLSSPDHLTRVSLYSKLIASKMGLTDSRAKEIASAAKLHDIGKIAVPNQIIFKSGALSEQEWEEIKQVPIIGSQILRDAESTTLQCAYDIALNLHETWNGEGYPSQLSHSSIPLAARIVAVADTFDSMIHSRSYKAALTIENAISEIRALSNEKFDPHVVSAFNACIKDILDINKDYMSDNEILNNQYQA